MEVYAVLDALGRFLEKLLVENPTAAVLLAALILFVWALLRIVSMSQTTSKEMAASCHEVQRDSTEAIRENTAVVRELKGELSGLRRDRAARSNGIDVGASSGGA